MGNLMKFELFLLVKFNFTTINIFGIQGLGYLLQMLSFVVPYFRINICNANGSFHRFYRRFAKNLSLEKQIFVLLFLNGILRFFYQFIYAFLVDLIYPVNIILSRVQIFEAYNALEAIF
ncbi:hypothetical protein OROMI_025333 [Orobanche minor]